LISVTGQQYIMPQGPPEIQGVHRNIYWSLQPVIPI
jgi:hypothetical protein